MRHGGGFDSDERGLGSRGEIVVVDLGAPTRYRQRVGIARAGIAAGLFGLVVVSCAGRPESAPAVSQSPAAIATPISKATWTDGPWPFTVSEGVLRCRFYYHVTFTADGVEYAVNTAAKKTAQFGDIDDIVPEMPGGPIGYVDINGERQPVKVGPHLDRVLSRGIDLCD
jgi:hypothetical protein